MSALLIGTGVSTYFAFRSEALRRVADDQWQRAEKEREHADRAREKEAGERREAQREARKASQALQKASDALQRLGSQLYCYNIALAYQRWLTHDVAGAEKLLDDCPRAARNWEWGYLKWLCNPCLRTYAIQRDFMDLPLTDCVAAFAPDRNRVAIGGDDVVGLGVSTLTVQDLSSGNELFDLLDMTGRDGPAGHPGRVRSVAFSPDGARIASGTDKGNVAVWDATTGAELQRLEADSTAVTSIVFAPDGKRIGTGGAHGTLTVWDLHAGRELFRSQGHADCVEDVAFSPDSATVASAGADRLVIIWDVHSGRELHRLKGHRSEVCSVEFSPGGRRIASGGADGTILVWDASTGDKQMTIEGHAHTVQSVALSPDGKRIASASHDNTVGVWDGQNGTPLLRLQGHENNVVTAEFSPDGTQIVSCSCSGTVKVWDVTSAGELLELKGHRGPANCVACDESGSHIASGADDGTVTLWDAATSRERQIFTGHTGKVTAIAFGPFTDWIASTSEDGTVRLWDTDSGRPFWQTDDEPKSMILEAEVAPIRALAVDPLGHKVAAGGKLVQIWVLEETLVAPPPEKQSSGARLPPAVPDVSVEDSFALRTHSGHVRALAFSPYGEQIATGGSSGTLTIWDLQTRREMRKLEGHSKSVESVAFSPNQEDARIVSAGADGTVIVWDVSTGREMRTLSSRYTAHPISVAFSHDGARIATVSRDGTLAFWDASTGQVLLVMKGQHEALRDVTFDLAGTIFASATSDGTLSVRRSFGHNPGEYFSNFHGPRLPFGLWRLIASGGSDDTLRIWDWGGGQELCTVEGHDDSLSCVTFSPDAERIASASRDSTIKLWNLCTGRARHLGIRFRKEGNYYSGMQGLIDPGLLASDYKRSVSDNWQALTEELQRGTSVQLERVLEGHAEGITSIAFSPDGGTIASGSLDGTLKIWDAATGVEVHTFRGHSGNVNVVAFTPDGKRIVSGSDDHTVRLWDVPTGRNVRTLKGHTGSVISVALSPDGRRVASGGHDETVRLWDLDVGKGLLTLSGHTGQVTSVAFSADGSRIASGSLDTTVRVWDADTGKELRVFTEHTKGVESVAFCGYRWIGSAGADERVIISDVSIGEVVCTLPGHVGPVKSVAFCWPIPASKAMETAGEDTWSALLGLDFGLGRTDTKEY
jgi:WD40 repeat protein